MIFYNQQQSTDYDTCTREANIYLSRIKIVQKWKLPKADYFQSCHQYFFSIFKTILESKLDIEVSTFFEETIDNLSKTASFVYDVKCLKLRWHIVLLLLKFYKRIKIVNQLSRRITNSLFSLECFVCAYLKLS